MLANESYILTTGPYTGISLRERFCSQVDISGECWNWIGPTYPNGYGKFRHQETTSLSHRVSYEWSHGVSLSRKNIICHICDNRRCVRPSHLVNADHSYNVQDMIRKGRGNFAKGINAGNSKLDERSVELIKLFRYEFNIKLSDIAFMFQVSQKQISVISRGVQWSHLK